MEGQEQYWVQVDGGPPYATDDAGRLWAMLHGFALGAGKESGGAREWATRLVDRVVKEQANHVEGLKDGRILRVSIIRPGEDDE